VRPAAEPTAVPAFAQAARGEARRGRRTGRRTAPAPRPPAAGAAGRPRRPTRPARPAAGAAPPGGARAPGWPSAPRTPPARPRQGGLGFGYYHIHPAVRPRVGSNGTERCTATKYSANLISLGIPVMPWHPRATARSGRHESGTLAPAKVGAGPAHDVTQTQSIARSASGPATARPPRPPRRRAARARAAAAARRAAQSAWGAGAHGAYRAERGGSRASWRPASSAYTNRLAHRRPSRARRRAARSPPPSSQSMPSAPGAPNAASTCAAARGHREHLRALLVSHPRRPRRHARPLGAGRGPLVRRPPGLSFKRPRARAPTKQGKARPPAARRAQRARTQRRTACTAASAKRAAPSGQPSCSHTSMSTSNICSSSACARAPPRRTVPARALPQRVPAPPGCVREQASSQRVHSQGSSMALPTLQMLAWPYCAGTGRCSSGAPCAHAAGSGQPADSQLGCTLGWGPCLAPRSRQPTGEGAQTRTLKTLNTWSPAPGPHTAPSGTSASRIAGSATNPAGLHGARLAPLAASLAGQVSAQALHQVSHQHAAARGRAVGVRAARARSAQAARRAEQRACRRLQRVGARGRPARVAQLVQRREALRREGLGTLDGRRAGRACWSALRGALATRALLQEALCAAGTATGLPGCGEDKFQAGSVRTLAAGPSARAHVAPRGCGRWAGPRTTRNWAAGSAAPAPARRNSGGSAASCPSRNSASPRSSACAEP